MLQIYTKILTWYKKLFKIYFNDFLKAPEWYIFYKAKLLPCGRDFLSSATMEPHCALGKTNNLLVHVHNKIHQSNLNSF